MSTLDSLCIREPAPPILTPPTPPPGNRLPIPVCSQSTAWAEMSSELISIGMESINPKISEDCLYLNIYTPADLTKRSRLPVMVWIHGGALLMGGASIYDGLVLSAHENVVVVTIQYRLGIWGFFSTGDEHSRGNWGHLDQVAALRWVQENIANFGGDPGSVTIFGESAGGESVSVLVLSPLAKNLFHRAISESGVALLPGLVKKDSKAEAKRIAAFAGCKTTTSAVLVHCLRQKTEDELLEITQKMSLLTRNFPGRNTPTHFMRKLISKCFEKREEYVVTESSGNSLKSPGVDGFRHGWIWMHIWTFGFLIMDFNHSSSLFFLERDRVLSRWPQQETSHQT
ncbi:hypothetical protein FD754_023957, partial [Muntiacus muntjak]